MNIITKSFEAVTFGSVSPGDVFRESSYGHGGYLKIDFTGITIDGCRELPNPAALITDDCQKFLKNKHGGWAVSLSSGRMEFFEHNVVVYHIADAEVII